MLRRALPLALLLLGSISTSPPAWAEPEADAGDQAEVEAAPTWRFRKDDRPVKVVVLAGSIGAYKRDPYAEQLAGMCANVEVHNLSQTGLGAWALKQRFSEQVLDNRHLRWNVEGQEHWLVFGGGLNSVGNPHSTNHHMRRLFELAHRRGMKIVGLTLSPWGDDSDKRWRGIEGLRSIRHTRAVVDFTLGRLSPREALGGLADKRRVGAEAPWDPTELPDIGIDLYDSPLRDAQAPLRDVEALRKALREDRAWQREHADLDEAQRQAALEADAQEAAEIPRWYLRPELRSFDHIHPNADGHRLMTQIMCPSLPKSWGCSCTAPAGAQ
ncbi:MAG: hypothetical protein KDK70_16525 [Myxococcales bacterium]|nr:hypothetical protein [Myxococcales bacterium]